MGKNWNYTHIGFNEKRDIFMINEQIKLMGQIFNNKN
jgi:hypothetical protein